MRISWISFPKKIIQGANEVKKQCDLHKGSIVDYFQIFTTGTLNENNTNILFQATQ